MSKTGIFYSFNTVNTKKIAELIQTEFGNHTVEMVNAEMLTSEQFLAFDFFIIGAPTWFDGELPNYWDEFVPEIKEMDLTGKTFALFGLGNQTEYPENFGDAIGILANLFTSKGGKVVGATTTDGYTFEKSAAIINGKFIGLMIDIENQDNLTSDRVKSWVKQLKKELK